MGILIQLDDSRTNNNLLFYSRSSRNINGYLNQNNREVVNTNKFYDNLNGFMRSYNDDYIYYNIRL